MLSPKQTPNQIRYGAVIGTKNIRVDALSRKAELQSNKKPLGAMLKKDKDRLIRYNYLKIIAT